MSVVLPVRIRIGDAPEAEVGSVSVDAAEALPKALADFLRALAAAYERSAEADGATAHTESEAPDG